MPDLRTVDLRGVEIIRPGTFDASTGRATITRKMLEGIVSTYEALKGKFRAPAKLGHATKPDNGLEKGMPSAGWLENIRLQGETLVADIMRVPAKLADIIKAGGYRGRSAEIREDFEVDGQTYPWALTGLAFLGAEIPAVSGLADIAKLYEAGEPALWCAFEGEAGASVIQLAEDDDGMDPMSRLEALLDEFEPRLKGAAGVRDLRALRRTFVKNLKAIMAGRKVDAAADPQSTTETDMDSKKIAAALGLPEDADEDAILAAAKAKQQPGDLTALEASHKETTTKLAAAETKIAAMEAARETERKVALFEASVKEGKFTPAQRARLLGDGKDAKGAWHALSVDDVAALCSEQPKVVDLSERGHGGDGIASGAGDFALTVSERKTFAAAGMDLSDPDVEWLLVREKAAAKNVTLPAKRPSAAAAS